MWGVYEIGMEKHVVPENDSDSHNLSPHCKCEPRMEEEEDFIIYVHDSFDGRIAVEIANEILENNDEN